MEVGSFVRTAAEQEAFPGSCQSHHVILRAVGCVPLLNLDEAEICKTLGRICDAF